MKIYGGGLVAKTLKHFGVRTLFSLPGHQTLSVFDACLDENLDLISTRHEASAVFMAQAQSYLTRQPGVAIVAGGPELTNGLTAIAQCYYAKTPLLVISGANTLQKRDKGFPQDMDQLQVVRPFTKWARSCHDVRRIPEYIATAYRQAIRGRPGPVYLEIPYDVMETKLEESAVSLPDRPALIRSTGDQRSLEKMAALLQQARHPIAIAGSGALWSQAEEALLVFARQTGIPLFLSNGALAMPFPPEAVYGIGYLGVNRPSMEAISEADVIVLLGERVNFNLGFGQPPFVSDHQKIIQIDIEPEEIDANRKVELGMNGDLRQTLERFNELPLDLPSWGDWHSRLQQKGLAYSKNLNPLSTSVSKPIHPLRLVSEIEALRSDDSYLVLDGANSILWALMTLQLKPQGGMVMSTMGELQAIGAGVPQAIAIKRARPEHQVILHTGDGSLGYGLMEFETALRYGIPIVAVVHNDSGWGMTRDMQVEYFGKQRQIGNQLGAVRYDQMVSALGGYGELVEQPEEIQPAIQRALESGLPACVNVMVDPEPKSPGLITFFMMEVMLGKQTYYDQLPDWIRKLGNWGLETPVTRAILRYLDRKLHQQID